MPDMTDVLRGIAARSLETQRQESAKSGGPPDYTGEDGLLYCGKCHTKKQMWLKNDFFKEPILVATICDCAKEAEERRRKEEEYQRDMDKIQRLRLGSLMDSKFREATFQQAKHNVRNLQLCRRYAENFDEMMAKNQGLLFYGNVGTGKTFSAACIANYLLDRKVSTVMTSFIKIIGSASLTNREEAMNFTDRLNRAKLLIIDDLGAERGTDYALERVYDIIDSRYRARLPMILTTNVPIGEMMECADRRYSRIYDRIFEVCYPMEFKGTSWRKAEASRRFDDMEKFLEGAV
ncbi:ATP-binding protein [Oscillospiraceae bacterium 50-16]